MRRLLFLLLVVAALAVAPTAGSDDGERVGTRLNLLAGGFQVFPAGVPFHVAHGWVRPLDEDQGSPPQANGRYGFSLAVDGVDDPADHVERAPFEDAVLGRIKPRTWVHNFPDGLTGTHAFTGHWFGPCTGLLDGGYTAGPCEHPTEITTAIGILWITVVFVP